MKIFRFVIASIILHMILSSALLLVSPEKVHEKKHFVTRLVTPEELVQAGKDEKKEEIRPLPVPSPRRLPDKSLNRTERPPANLPVTPRIQREVKPVVPGNGFGEDRKPLILRPEDQGKGLQGQGKERLDKEGDSTKRGDKNMEIPSRYPGYLDRKGLFDKGIVEEMAKGEAEGKKKKDETITFDTSDYQYAGYMSLLKAKIEGSGCWVYPAGARSQGLYGDLKIRFTIKKDGSLGPVELVRTSGYKDLDDAALRAVRDCGPYWPLPDSWKRDTYSILGHFIYVPYGAFVR